MYVFYNQLCVAASQYGIYLQPLEELQYDESLCPDVVSQYAITEHDYQQTKALCENLSSFDIIHVEFTTACNILK